MHFIWVENWQRTTWKKIKLSVAISKSVLPSFPPPLLNKIFLNIYFCIYGTPTASALFVCICCCCCICIWILGVIHLVLPANILVVYLVPHKISLLCDLPGAEGIIPYLWEQDCSPAALWLLFGGSSLAGCLDSCSRSGDPGCTFSFKGSWHSCSCGSLRTGLLKKISSLCCSKEAVLHRQLFC